jgi:hypothetical protein
MTGELEVAMAYFKPLTRKCQGESKNTKENIKNNFHKANLLSAALSIIFLHLC